MKNPSEARPPKDSPAEHAIVVSENRYLPLQFLVRLDPKSPVGQDQYTQTRNQGNLSLPAYRQLSGEAHELVHDFQFRATRWGFFLSTLRFDSSLAITQAMSCPAAAQLFKADQNNPTATHTPNYQHHPSLMRWQRLRKLRMLMQMDHQGTLNLEAFSEELDFGLKTAWETSNLLFESAGPQPQLKSVDSEHFSSHWIGHLPTVSILELQAKCHEWLLSIETTDHPGDPRFAAYTEDMVIELEESTRSIRKHAGSIVSPLLDRSIRNLNQAFACHSEQQVLNEMQSWPIEKAQKYSRKLIHAHHTFLVTASIICDLALQGQFPPYAGHENTTVLLEDLHPAPRFVRLAEAAVDHHLFTGDREKPHEVAKFRKALLEKAGMPAEPCDKNYPQVPQTKSQLFQSRFTQGHELSTLHADDLHYMDYLAWNYANFMRKRSTFIQTYVVCDMTGPGMPHMRNAVIETGDPGCSGAILYTKGDEIFSFPATGHPKFPDGHFDPQILWNNASWFITNLAWHEGLQEFARTRSPIKLKAFPSGVRAAVTSQLYQDIKQHLQNSTE